jgi:transposase-like protein
MGYEEISKHDQANFNAVVLKLVGNIEVSKEEEAMSNALKYNAEIHKKIVTAIKGGATHKAAARASGVTPETLSHWKKQYPEFCEDIARAEAEAQAFAESTLYDLARKGNLKAVIHWLARRCPSEWSGKEQQPDDIVIWPDSVAGWTALHFEYEARSKEFFEGGKQNATQTAAEESPPIQGDTTNGSEAAA